MKKIGMIGDLGTESIVPYYHYITQRYIEEYSGREYPDIIIHCIDVREHMDEENVLAEKVRTAIIRLHEAGVDFVIAASSSLHIIYDEISEDLPVPWISIIDVTAGHIKKKGWKKVGLLGKVHTMSKRFYVDALDEHGIECIVPDQGFQKKVSDIIFDELVKGEVHDDSRTYMLERIEALFGEGAQAVLLACTELPLLVTQKDTQVPIVDTMALHAQRALDIAFGKARL